MSLIHSENLNEHRYTIKLDDDGDHVQLILARNRLSYIKFVDVSYSRFGLHSSLYRVFHSFDQTLNHEIEKLKRSIVRHHSQWMTAQSSIDKVV